jgi:hypothetical protein
MGAPIKQKEGYRQESASLQRIHRRISEDDTRDPAWRVKMLGLLDKLVAGFNEDTVASLIRKGDGEHEESSGSVDGSSDSEVNS